MPTDFGTVYLIGAGPGDPGLLTLRGAECLAAADLILYDYLSGPELLHHTRSNAELVCLGRHGHGRLLPQSEINERMVTPHRPARQSRGSKGATPRSSLAWPKRSPRWKPPACRTKSSPASPPLPLRAATPASRSPIAMVPHASLSSPARNARTRRRTKRSTTPRSLNSRARSCSTWASPPRRIGAASSCRTARASSRRSPSSAAAPSPISKPSSPRSARFTSTWAPASCGRPRW